MRASALPSLAFLALPLCVVGAVHAQSVQLEAQHFVVVAHMVQAAHRAHGYTDLSPSKVVGRTAWGDIRALPAVADAHLLDLNTNFIPHHECKAFISAIAPHFDTILVGDSGPNDIGTAVVSHGRINTVQLNRWCSWRHRTVGLDAITD
jgi:hypothetical protein